MAKLAYEINCIEICYLHLETKILGLTTKNFSSQINLLLHKTFYITNIKVLQSSKTSIFIESFKEEEVVYFVVNKSHFKLVECHNLYSVIYVRNGQTYFKTFF